MASTLVIIGNGFAALAAALCARRHDKGNQVKIIMVSPSREQIMRFLLFRSNPDNTVINIDDILSEQRICHQRGNVTQIDALCKKLRLDDGQTVPYDKLIIATGSLAKPSEIADKNQLAFNLYDFDSAKRLEQHLTALMTNDPLKAYRFAIIGTSCTAIEVACELRKKYGPPSALEIILYEKEDHIYPSASTELREIVLTQLKQQHIALQLNCHISQITRRGLIIDGKLHPADTVILATGLIANSLIEGLPADRNALGQIKMSPDCRVSHDIFAAGDVAYIQDSSNSGEQMSAQRALLTGKVAGHNAMGELLHGAPSQNGACTFAYAQYSNPILSTILDMGPTFGISARGRAQQKVIATGETGAFIKELFCHTLSPRTYKTSPQRLDDITNPRNLSPLAPYFAFDNPETTPTHHDLPAIFTPEHSGGYYKATLQQLYNLLIFLRDEGLDVANNQRQPRHLYAMTSAPKQVDDAKLYEFRDDSEHPLVKN